MSLGTHDTRWLLRSHDGLGGRSILMRLLQRDLQLLHDLRVLRLVLRRSREARARDADAQRHEQSPVSSHELAVRLLSSSL